MEYYLTLVVTDYLIGLKISIYHIRILPYLYGRENVAFAVYKELTAPTQFILVSIW